MLESAELHSAFVWDCDACGQENFCRAIEGNIDEAALRDADEDRIDAHLEADEWTMSDEAYFSPILIQRIALTPKVVKCCQCEAQYKPRLSHERADEADQND